MASQVWLQRSRHPRYVPLAVPASATDKEVADKVYAELKLPLTRPMPGWFLRRTSDHHLLLDFYHINGIIVLLYSRMNGSFELRVFVTTDGCSWRTFMPLHLEMAKRRP
jgi:hypothetical protein